MKRTLGHMVVAVALLVVFAGVAKADQMFQTDPGAVNPITLQPVSATADFSLSGNTLTIVLTNTTPGIKSAGQLLTGLYFTLSNGSGVSLTGENGDLVHVNGDTTFNDLGPTALNWGFGSVASNGFELCVICTGSVNSSVTPSEGILGPVSGDGKYDNANNSITGNGPHNPFVNGSGTFTLNVPSNVKVSDVVFTFGTQAGATVTAPEPASLLLLGLGLAGMPFLRRRRS